MSAIWPDTPRRACAARGYVIALGLYSAKISQEGFSSNLMGSSTRFAARQVFMAFVCLITP